MIIIPTYCFICHECGSIKEVVKPVSERNDLVQCDTCRCAMLRDFAAEGVNSGNKEYAKPIHSDAMAISPDRIKEHQQNFPDVKLDSQCRPVLENYQQHKKYAEGRGFIKPPIRKKKRGKRIA